MDLDQLSRTLAELLELVNGRKLGKYRGTVAPDPENSERPLVDSEGRLAVRVPAMSPKQETVPIWAMPCSPLAGRNVGFFAIPPVGSGVWVEFEGGDPSHAIWTGCFWGHEQLPEKANPSVSFFKTATGCLRMDDDEGELTLTVGDSVVLVKNGTISLTVGDTSVTVTGSEVVLNSARGSKLAVSDGVSVNDDALELF